MTAGIYLIQCINTEKVYVGSSANIELRWKQHIEAYNSFAEGYNAKKFAERPSSDRIIGEGKKLTISMPDFEYEALTHYAHAVGRTKSDLIREFARSLPILPSKVSLSSLLDLRQDENESEQVDQKLPDGWEICPLTGSITALYKGTKIEISPDFEGYILDVGKFPRRIVNGDTIDVAILTAKFLIDLEEVQPNITDSIMVN